MKKWIVGIIICVVILTSLIYVFIPGSIVISKSIFIEKNLTGLRRVLSENKNWYKWWPGPSKEIGRELLLNGNSYTISDKTISSIFIDIKNKSINTKTSLTLIPGTADSVKLEWDVQIPTSNNPVKRLQVYLSTNSLQHDISIILSSIKTYYSTTANLYDLDIRRDIVKNSSLISTYDSSKGYPSTEKIYSLIDQLRKYIASQHAQATDSPMLNIYTKDSLYYLTKVAIPTDKKLASNGKIEYRWMLGGGNILTAEVKGVPKKIDSAFTIVEDYVQDYQLAAPAIAFYSLVTNRLAERDSTKWVTKIYYPIMYFK